MYRTKLLQGLYRGTGLHYPTRLTTPFVFAENWKAEELWTRINKRPPVWEQRRTNSLCAVSSQLEELHKKYYCIGNGIVNINSLTELHGFDDPFTYGKTHAT